MYHVSKTGKKQPITIETLKRNKGQDKIQKTPQQKIEKQ